jgi:hypothetical protein
LGDSHESETHSKRMRSCCSTPRISRIILIRRIWACLCCRVHHDNNKIF